MNNDILLELFRGILAAKAWSALYPFSRLCKYTANLVRGGMADIENAFLIRERTGPTEIDAFSIKSSFPGKLKHGVHIRQFHSGKRAYDVCIKGDFFRWGSRFGKELYWRQRVNDNDESEFRAYDINLPTKYEEREYREHEHYQTISYYGTEVTITTYHGDKTDIISHPSTAVNLEYYREKEQEIARMFDEFDKII